MNKFIWLSLVMAAVTLVGCAAPSGYRAPIIDRSVSASGNAGVGRRPGGNESPAANASVSTITNESDDSQVQAEKDWRPQVYKVQKGDTLYSIAFNFGFDYHDLAVLNGIPDPAVIHIGQEIRLFPPGGSVGNGIVVSAVNPSVQITMLDIKSQPMVSKLPYSEQAVAQVERAQIAPPKIETESVAQTKPAVGERQSAPELSVTAGTAEAVKWEMPTSGKVVGNFSENDNRKGIDIVGKLGQPVYASASGKVVYSGNGLRGYGKLIIIKHNNTFLSAYAHNDKLLVKEGQMIAKGQMIAAMGSTDADRVMLHFEIRKLGKPVDPAKYLTIPKS